ncbi:MAG: HtaA domain-containing protein [Microbacterium sp.]
MSVGGELRWAVKDSFLRYVRVIAAGTVTVSGGAGEHAEGGFFWPLREARRDDDDLVLEFAGSVRFTAHAGFLDVELRDPQLRLGGALSALSVAAEAGEGRLTIATLVGEGGDALVPRLTEAGVPVFGDVYPAGTEFAPLTARVPRNGPGLPARG